MEKNVLDERIKNIAAENLRGVMIAFSKKVAEDPILSRLKIDTPTGRKLLLNQHGIIHGALFNGSSPKDGETDTNIIEIQRILLESFEKEIGAEILKKLGILEDFILRG